MDLTDAAPFEGDKPWPDPRRFAVEARIRRRLAETADRLGERDRHDGGLGTGDPMMVDVPRLAADVARGNARPAQRAMAPPLAGLTRSPPSKGDAG